MTERRQRALAPGRSLLRATPPPHLAFASWNSRRSSFFRPLVAVSPGTILSASFRVTAARAAIQASTEPFSQTEIVPDPPHSLASDSWKGLVFSLMAGNRNAEALGELNKIPPSPRELAEEQLRAIEASEDGIERGVVVDGVKQPGVLNLSGGGHGGAMQKVEVLDARDVRVGAGSVADGGVEAGDALHPFDLPPPPLLPASSRWTALGRLPFRSPPPAPCRA